MVGMVERFTVTSLHLEGLSLFLNHSLHSVSTGKTSRFFLHAMQSQRSLRETKSMLKYVFMFVA